MSRHHRNKGYLDSSHYSNVDRPRASRRLGPASGQAAHGEHSPYVVEESRAVKSLSPEDIAELRRGGGWGLAKAAELNGMPGPVHLLELKDQIPLTSEQVVAVTAIHERMRADAIVEGERFIAAEKALEEASRAGKVSEESLRAMLNDIEQSQREVSKSTPESRPIRCQRQIRAGGLRRRLLLRPQSADGRVLL